MLTAGGLLLFALEGVVCVAMAAPIALTIVVVGALLGRAVAIYGRPAIASILVVVASLPLLGFAETLSARRPSRGRDHDRDRCAARDRVVTRDRLHRPAAARGLGVQHRHRLSDSRAHRGLGCGRGPVLRVLDRCLHRADHGVGAGSPACLRRPQSAARDARVELLRRRAPAAPRHAAAQPTRRVPADQAAPMAALTSKATPGTS